MYNFVSLHVNCPECKKSLMDNEYLVDNEPSIMVNIEVGGKVGNLHLSSVYGSFNYSSSVELKDQEIVKFSCPHCKKELSSKESCGVCDAHMVPFVLETGGKVTICSRVGCHNHMIGFEDFSLALQKLHDVYEIGKHSHAKNEVKKSNDKKAEALKKEIIETGEYLPAFCPVCKKSIVEDEQLYLKIIKENGETGMVILSPYLNLYKTKSTMHNPENSVPKDIQCYHCGASFIDSSKKCDACGSPTAKINISARTKFIDFYICSKKGCKWHGLSEQDMHDIRLEDSLEW